MFSETGTRFADLVTIWVVHLPEQTETGRPNYCIGRDWGQCIAAVAGFCQLFHNSCFRLNVNITIYIGYTCICIVKEESKNTKLLIIFQNC